MNTAARKVLLIEDNLADAQLIIEILKEDPENTIEVRYADNMARGLEAITNGNVDIVLLDLTLPDSSGYDTFMTVQKHNSTLPVIVLTGQDDMELALRIVRDGAQDYLVKNLVDYTMLARSIRYSIERKQALLEKDRLIVQLREALANVKTLSGLLPICASCKHIRDDKGYWQQVESYIQQHSAAVFTHSICPKCTRKLYPTVAAAQKAAEGQPPSKTS